jgi:hypothetical protein
MDTKGIKKRIDVDESRSSAERGTARQRLPLVTHPVPRSYGKHLDTEESTEAGLVRLPAGNLPDSFYEMPVRGFSCERRLGRHLGAG